MKKLKSVFKDAFGVPIEQVIPLKKNLIPIEGNPEDALLFGSKVAAEQPYLLDPSMEEMVPEGYFLVGFWGYGANSSAFYFQMVDTWKRVWFRLPYGGAYADVKFEANNIMKFLPKYFEFQEKLYGEVKKLLAMESMGGGYYKIVKTDDNILEVRESFLLKPDFQRLLSQVINLH